MCQYRPAANCRQRHRYNTNVNRFSSLGFQKLLQRKLVQLRRKSVQRKHCAPPVKLQTAYYKLPMGSAPTNRVNLVLANQYGCIAFHCVFLERELKILIM
jgi:hypothetical protein